MSWHCSSSCVGLGDLSALPVASSAAYAVLCIFLLKVVRQAKLLSSQEGNGSEGKVGRGGGGGAGDGGGGGEDKPHGAFAYNGGYYGWVCARSDLLVEDTVTPSNV